MCHEEIVIKKYLSWVNIFGGTNLISSFSLSAKALPFIPRGQYTFVRGRRLEEPYTLTDIYPVSTITFSVTFKYADACTLEQMRCFFDL